MKLAGDQGLVIPLFLLCYASLLRRDPLCRQGLCYGREQVRQPNPGGGFGTSNPLLLRSIAGGIPCAPSPRGNKFASLIPP